MDLHDSFNFFLTQWCHLGSDLSRTGLLVLARVPCLHKACVAPMSVEEEFLHLYEELLKTGPVDAPRLAENTGLEPEEADLVLKCIADYLEEHNQKPPVKRPAKSEPKAKQSAAKRKAKAAPVLEEAPAAGCAETQLDRQDTQAVDSKRWHLRLLLTPPVEWMTMPVRCLTRALPPRCLETLRILMTR